MALKSHIEWTESTWNPVTGCSKISLGCKNCYAERMALRLQAMGRPNYRNGFKVAIHTQALDIPLNWKKPQTIFVNSMSDLFHEEMPFEYLDMVFNIIKKTQYCSRNAICAKAYHAGIKSGACFVISRSDALASPTKLLAV